MRNDEFINYLDRTRFQFLLFTRLIDCTKIEAKITFFFTRNLRHTHGRIPPNAL